MNVRLVRCLENLDRLSSGLVVLVWELRPVRQDTGHPLLRLADLEILDRAASAACLDLCFGLRVSVTLPLKVGTRSSAPIVASRMVTGEVQKKVVPFSANKRVRSHLDVDKEIAGLGRRTRRVSNT